MLKSGGIFQLQVQLLLMMADKHVGTRPGFDMMRTLVNSFVAADPDLASELFYEHMRPFEERITARDSAVLKHFEEMKIFNGIGLYDAFADASEEDKTQLWAIITTMYFMSMSGGDVLSALSGSVTGIMSRMGIDLKEMRVPGGEEALSSQLESMLPRISAFMPNMMMLADELKSGNEPAPLEPEDAERMQALTENMAANWPAIQGENRDPRMDDPYSSLF